MEIADAVIEQLFISLIIPVVRPSSIKVFRHILCSAQSKPLFDKIVGRIPKVLQYVENSCKATPNDQTMQNDFQDMIDLVWIFVNKYNNYDDTYVEVVIKKKQIIIYRKDEMD